MSPSATCFEPVEIGLDGLVEELPVGAVVVERHAWIVFSVGWAMTAADVGQRIFGDHLLLARFEIDA